MSKNPLAVIKQSFQNQEILLPILRKFLAEENQRSRSESGVHADAVREDARLSVLCFQDREAEYNHGDANPYEGYFHPSRIGACLRQLFYSDYDAPVDRYPSGSELLQSHLVFETGTYTHVLFQNLCERAGVLKERESLIVDHDENIVGHCDGILSIAGHPDYNLEIKTINSIGFSKLKDAKDEHKMQATAYMHAKKLAATIFIYLEKDRHNIKEYKFDYAPKFWLSNVRSRIQNYFVKREAKHLPDREGDNPRSFPCLYCPYTKVCFDTRNSEIFEDMLKQKDPITIGAYEKSSKKIIKVKKPKRLVRRKRSKTT